MCYKYVTNTKKRQKFSAVLHFFRFFFADKLLSCLFQVIFQSYSNVLLQVSKEELIVVKMIYAIEETRIAVLFGGNVCNT